MTVNISEFEAAVADFEDVVLQVDGGWDDREHLDMRRRHVIALHRQANQAGLRELKVWVDSNGARYDVVYDFAGDIADEIDAMLNGGTDGK